MDSLIYWLIYYVWRTADDTLYERVHDITTENWKTGLYYAIKPFFVIPELLHPTYTEMFM